MSTTIDVACYLVIGQKVTTRGMYAGSAAGKPSLRVTINKPATAQHEISLAIHLQLPLSLFLKPSLSASIVVSPDQAPIIITPEIVQNIADVIKEQHGIVLRIEAPPAPEGPA